MNERRPAAMPRRPLPVWLPWLLAPAFALLPMIGCGAAATLKHGRSLVLAGRPAASSPPLVPVAAVVTAVSPGR